MRAPTLFAKIGGRFIALAHNRDGVSAVEFSIILPFMLIVYIGSVEIGDGLAIDFKVSEAARTVTDLTSQYSAIDAPTMSQILGASATVVSPYSSSGMSVTVSELQITTNGKGTVLWSCSLNGTPRPQNQKVTPPSNLQSPPATVYLIWGEVAYPYSPAMGFVVTNTINIKQSMYFYPRLSSQISGPGTGTAPVSCTL